MYPVFNYFMANLFTRHALAIKFSETKLLAHFSAPRRENSFYILDSPFSLPRMRLLLTNDDGIESHFLHTLARALLDDGHTLAVVAPLREQSWIGAAKSRHHTIASTRVDIDLPCPTWTVDSTPSDCVNIALAHLLPAANFPRPDAVVSGINHGMNASLGFILASGTIGGAWEGAVHGLPALALSQDLTVAAFDRLKKDKLQPDAELLETLTHTARHAARLVPQIITANPSCGFVLHNLNFPYPCHATTEVRRTIPSHLIVPSLFSPAADDGTHNFIFAHGTDLTPPDAPLTDHQALLDGHISHSLLDYRRLAVI